MKLNLISLCLSAALVPSIAAASTTTSTPPTSETPTSTAWTQTDENGGFTQTMTLQGNTETVIPPWLWKVGDGNPKTADGKELFKIKSYEFRKGTDAALKGKGASGENGNYQYAIISPDEPIDLLSGYTEKPYPESKTTIVPKITIDGKVGNPIEINYASTGQTIKVKAIGKPLVQGKSTATSANDIDGFIELTVKGGIQYYANMYDRNGKPYSGGVYEAPGMGPFVKKADDILKDNYSDFNTTYKRLYGNHFSIAQLATGNFSGTTWSNYLAKEISGGVYIGAENLKMVWTGHELPASWEAPLNVTVTMF